METRHGVVHISHNDELGGICDSDFTDEDATVVCRMAGYDAGIGFCCGGLGAVDPGKPMWMKDIVCSGTETDVADCSWDGLWNRTDCTNAEAVGVVCYLNSNTGIETRDGSGVPRK